MLMRKISAILAVAAVTTVAACGSESPKTSAELEGLLINAGDAGIEGLTEGQAQRDFALPPFEAFGAAAESASPECKDAVAQAGGLTYDRVGSAGRYLSTADQSKMVMVALYSSESDSHAIGDTLSNIANNCDGQEVEAQDGNNYSFHKVPDGYDGVEMKMAMGGTESNTVALVGYKGAQMVYVSGISVPADEVTTVFDAQMDKL